MFGGRIQGRSGFIQHQQIGFLTHQHAGCSQPLPLAAGQFYAGFPVTVLQAEQCVILVGQPGNKAGRAALLGRLPHPLPVINVGHVAHAYIFLHRQIILQKVLEDAAKTPAQRLGGVMANVHPIP